MSRGLSQHSPSLHVLSRCHADVAKQGSFVHGSTLPRGDVGRSFARLSHLGRRIYPGLYWQDWLGDQPSSKSLSTLFGHHGELGVVSNISGTERARLDMFPAV